ncbi:DNA-binding protein [Brumimicrobium glaciale]|uniref:DNA-binding protein n=1 Tax=Brumimicrobium glaciale TaxID=200475 RepID=A0A4Q4KGP6_9FLAO|nr:DNA-binding protein [Brumimicrobium glaciale]RYM32312.1 DNA-binding protein [Brumimicrobium glaciale]
MKDLTISAIDRQNILNNLEAINNIQSYLGVTGMLFKNEYRFTKDQISEFYNIDISTIDSYLSNYDKELKHNGYELLKGKLLKSFKEEFGGIINIQSKTTQLGVFNFRAFLNLGMLLVESEMAKAVRSKMLDIVIDTLNDQLGGSTKYINQRDEDFFHSMLKEPHYRKEFTTALHDCLELGPYKYGYYTDEIYRFIFKENAKEYKHILNLKDNENVRDTMYSEVLNLIASFETGIAHEMQAKFTALGRKLSKHEMDELLVSFANHPLHKPHIENARTKMATRDYGFRKVLHDNLENYITSIDLSDYQRFLGDKSQSLQERINDNIEIFKRLKDR